MAEVSRARPSLGKIEWQLISLLSGASVLTPTKGWYAVAKSRQKTGCGHSISTAFIVDNLQRIVSDYPARLDAWKHGEQPPSAANKLQNYDHADSADQRGWGRWRFTQSNCKTDIERQENAQIWVDCSIKETIWRWVLGALWPKCESSGCCWINRFGHVLEKASFYGLNNAAAVACSATAASKSQVNHFVQLTLSIRITSL